MLCIPFYFCYNTDFLPPGKGPFLDKWYSPNKRYESIFMQSWGTGRKNLEHCTANKKLSAIPACHDQSWLCKTHSAPGLVILIFTVFQMEHTHIGKSPLALQYGSGHWLTPKQPPPLHLYTFPTVGERLSLAPGQGLSKKTQPKGSIKQRQVLVLLSWREEKRRASKPPASSVADDGISV